jgi:uncharacterized protein (DUF2062 family)
VVVVTYAYLRVYRRFHATNAASWRGMLPRHVVAIGVSYMMMIGGSISDLIVHVHEPLTWRTPVYALTYLLGSWSMWDVLGHSRHRYCELEAAAAETS